MHFMKYSRKQKKVKRGSCPYCDADGGLARVQAKHFTVGEYCKLAHLRTALTIIGVEGAGVVIG